MYKTEYIYSYQDRTVPLRTQNTLATRIIICRNAKLSNTTARRKKTKKRSVHEWRKQRIRKKNRNSLAQVDGKEQIRRKYTQREKICTQA